MSKTAAPAGDSNVRLTRRDLLLGTAAGTLGA
jgi:hypothetical protein